MLFYSVIIKISFDKIVPCLKKIITVGTVLCLIHDIKVGTFKTVYEMFHNMERIYSYDSGL